MSDFSQRETVAVLATSLTPRNIENQQQAVQSWRKAGFAVLSMNHPEEIAVLRPQFPQVRFIPASRNGREFFGKPLIYIDDLFGALKETQFEIVGIINSDIHLSLEPVHLDAMVRQTQDAVICVNRMNVKRLGDENAAIFMNGFDAFFFRRAMLDRIPPSRFCLGVAWWDYYVPIVCVLNRIPLARFQDPVAYHILHPLNWNENQWNYAAKYFFERLLELCGQHEGCHPFCNLGYKLREAWKLFHLILLNDCPISLIRKSYVYAEFILGIIYGQMKVLEPLCPDRMEKNPFALPDSSRITHALVSPSMTLVAVDKSAGPMVSAIVSTYQSEAFIGGCLQDLVEQTLYQKGLLEIIVVDSGSPQNEGAIVREFQSRYPNIRYIRTQQRETIYAAWNRGLREARGKYITNANTDDRHAPLMLEMLAAALEERPDKAAIYSHFYITEIPNQTWQTKTPVRLADWHPPFSREALLKGNFMGPQPMWRRSLHEEYGYFDPTFQVSGDWEFFLRVSQTHEFIRCRAILGLYYYNPKSLERSAGTREQEDRFIRELYTKNQNRIIRRPFRPEMESAFPDSSIRHQPVQQAAPRPLISVCMVTYNAQDSIVQAIQSVLSQTYQHFELLIVDDGSTDQTGRLAQSFSDARVRYIRQEHKNFAAGMNRAIQQAQGEFILGVDSDDFIAPDYLEKMAAFALQYPEYDYYYPEKLTLVDEAGNYTGTDWEYNDLRDSKLLPAILFAKGASPIPNSGSLKRRQMFERTGLFREIDNVEDFDFLARNALQIRFRKVQGSSCYYYRRSSSTNSRRFEQRNRLTAACLDEMIRHYSPEQLCPFLADVSEASERERRFLDYVISIFEKHAQAYHERAGEIFQEYADKYRQKKSEIGVQQTLKLALNCLEQKNPIKAAQICRETLSNKTFILDGKSRQTIQTLLSEIESVQKEEGELLPKC